MLENSKTEFKCDYSDSIRKSVIAFANTSGGKILVGVDDDGNIVGVTDPDATLRRITNVLRDSILPDITLYSQCNIETIDGHPVIKIDVQPGGDCPYYWREKGLSPEGVFVRQGSSSVHATREGIIRMIRRVLPNEYETHPSFEQSLAFTGLHQIFEHHGIPFGEQQCKTMKLKLPSGLWSNLGLILSDQNSHPLRIAVFDGLQKTNFRDRAEFNGNVLRQASDGYDFLERWNCTRSEFSGLERIDLSDYPHEALREAVLNLLIHKNYAVNAPALISIFDDRMEFVNLGGLMPDISLDDITLGVSVMRNPCLAAVFYRLGLIEAYGTGIPRIHSCYPDPKLAPKIEVSENAFKLTLYNRNYWRKNPKEEKRHIHLFCKADEHERKILELLNEKQSIVRSDVETCCNLSTPAAILLLRELQNRGTLQKIGAGKLTAYRRAK